MCCVSRVFTKKAFPLLSLTSHFYWLHNSAGWSSVWAYFRWMWSLKGRTAGCVCVCVLECEWEWVRVCECVYMCVCVSQIHWRLLRRHQFEQGIFLFTPTNLQGAFSICSVCSLWKTSDSFFNQSQMRQCESVCAWARQCVCQCMRIWGEYLLSREGEGRKNRVDFF